MGPEGLEQSALTPPKTTIPAKRGTESGTVDDETQQNDPDLASLIKAWPKLSDHIKQSIRSKRLGSV